MPTKIISRTQLDRLVPYSGSHIARLEKVGQFPKRVKLGANRVGWLEDEINAWIDERISARQKT